MHDVGGAHSERTRASERGFDQRRLRTYRARAIWAAQEMVGESDSMAGSRCDGLASCFAARSGESK